MTKFPTLSVIIPTHNNGQVALRIIKQTIAAPEVSEVIIVDDGSTDSTATALKTIKDSRLKIYNQKHRGPSAARNFGLQKATGDCIIFLDADDEIAPNFVHTLCQLQSKHPTLALVGIKQLYDQTSKTLYPYASPLPQQTSSNTDHLIKLLIRDGRLYPVTNKIFRRDLISSAHLRFDETLPLGEDLDFSLRYLKAALAENPRLTLLQDYSPLYLYHYAHSSSTVKSVAKSWSNWSKSYRKTKAVLGKASLRLYLRWRISWLKAKLNLL